VLHQNVSLTHTLKKANNNFDLIRLIAATGVLYSHSFDLFNSNGHNDPARSYLFYDSSGSLSVYVFFFLSGMFITKSFLQNNDTLEFCKHRFYRIWPALITCLIITVFIVGPIFTTANVQQYFADSQTWKYLFRNGTLYKDIIKPLPGVFESNHFPHVVNGSIWTLPIEIRCYLLVLVLGIFKFLNRKIILIVIFCLTLVFQESNWFNDICLYNIKSVQFFIAGIIAFSFRDDIKLNVRIMLVLLFVCVFARMFSFSFFLYSFYAVLLYSAVLFASLRSVIKLKLPGDYSYGIYIYGFLVQQCTAFALPNISSYQSMLITFPVTLFLGMCSWHFVEKVCLKYSRNIGIKKPRIKMPGG
jgi:peptidoglycan/LPS O-acetylase OafA/YrhL